MNVLVLNIDYTPFEVIPWQVAMEKLVMGKVELVVGYVGRVVRSATQTWPFPAVVRLVNSYARKRVRLNRRTIMARDSYTCQYCGCSPRRKDGTPKVDELTIDHVIPRAKSNRGWVCAVDGSKARVTSWENVVAACSKCNTIKADRTPSEARMALRSSPRAPTPRDLARMSICRYDVPTEWKDYL